MSHRMSTAKQSIVSEKGLFSQYRLSGEVSTQREDDEVDKLLTTNSSCVASNTSLQIEEIKDYDASDDQDSLNIQDSNESDWLIQKNK